MGTCPAELGCGEGVTSGGRFRGFAESRGALGTRLKGKQRRGEQELLPSAELGSLPAPSSPPHLVPEELAGFCQDQVLSSPCGLPGQHPAHGHPHFTEEVEPEFYSPQGLASSALALPSGSRSVPWSQMPPLRGPPAHARSGPACHLNLLLGTTQGSTCACSNLLLWPLPSPSGASLLPAPPPLLQQHLLILGFRQRDSLGRVQPHSRPLLVRAAQAAPGSPVGGRFTGRASAAPSPALPRS